MLQIQWNEGRIEHIYDSRYEMPVDITDGTGRFGFLAYTLKSEDINQQLKAGSFPFAEKHVGYDKSLKNDEFGTRLQVETFGNGLLFDLTCDGTDVDGAGLFLPFNFISRKNGVWQNQFTISSPYHSADYKHHMYYLAKPDGKAIACIVENEIDCYMINYSPYQGGHFIRGITFWSQLDKAYGRPKRAHKHVRVRILPVSSYMEAMELACKTWECCGLYYDISSAYSGAPFHFKTIGKVDEIRIQAPSGKELIVCEPTFVPCEYGIHKAVPYCNGKPGLDCAMFCADSIEKMHIRATQSIVQNTENVIATAADGSKIYDPMHITYRNYHDYNLCEHMMWCWSALKYLLRNPDDQRIHSDVKNLLAIIDPVNQVRKPRCSFDPDDHYNTLGDYRIQEPFNGVNILLTAYRVYKDAYYLDLAKKVLSNKLSVDQHEDGGVYRIAGADKHFEDYTTVTFMVLPVVDLALALREIGDPDAEFFANAAIRMADHMVSRGLDFPTEGGTDEEVNPEVEEGSMSCTALNVMYVYAKLAQKPEYVSFATEVLNYHDCYSVYTHHPCMYRSSLRWWETIWEGDADGPTICFGHAWTIWRAEAEFWYGIVQKDDDRLLDSFNGFMSNLSKTDKDGNMYAIYRYEQLSGPAMEDRGWMVDRRNMEGFPTNQDRTLSRYAWARAADTWFKTVAVLSDKVLMARLVDGVLVPDFDDFEQLYIGDYTGTFYIRAAKDFTIVSDKTVSYEGTGVIKVTVSD